MGNKCSSSYKKLSSDNEDKVCIIFPCYLAINKITNQSRCVCNKGKNTDNTDEMVSLTNRFYLPDKKIGFYFFKKNNIYKGEQFVLEDSLIMMYPNPFTIKNEKDFEKIITKKLYDAIVARYNWLFDANGKKKNNEKWSFVWTIKQKKELTRLNVF